MDGTYISEVAEDRLERNQQVRDTIIARITSGGKDIPSDEHTMSLLTSALDGSDRTTLGIARVRAQEKGNDDQSEIISGVSALLTTMARQSEIPRTKAPAPLPEGIIPHNPVAGEMGTDVSNETYEEFHKRLGANNEGDNT